jgi:hypothetical protein
MGVDTSTVALTRLGVAALASLAALTAANHWMAFQYLRARMVVDVNGVAALALGEIARAVAQDVAIVIAGLAVTVLALGAMGIARNRTRLLATLLLATAPLAVHAGALSVALLTVWQPNAWVMPAYGTTPPQVAATMVEAVPVLEPWPFVRVVAIGSSALFATILQARLCGLRGWRSAPAAVTLGALALVTHLTG